MRKVGYGVMMLALTAVLVAGMSPNAWAQSKKSEALSLVRSAMDAYSNLDFDGAQQSLEEAQTIAEGADVKTLARVYVSMGVVMIGGYSDNASGQDAFTVALCLDDNIRVDPLVSTPEIDMMFNLASKQVSDASCGAALSRISIPGGTPLRASAFPECGRHIPATEQRKGHELPVMIEPDVQMLGRLAKVVVRYSFDGATTYSVLPLRRIGAGFGSLISCDEGQIRNFDPNRIQYFIEGHDSMDQVICSTGTIHAPMAVTMTPTAEPLIGYPGLEPRECGQCPPWDPNCGGSDLPGLGEVCEEEPGCAGRLTCEAGVCEDIPPVPRSTPPKLFYAQVLGGGSVGYVKNDDFEARTVNEATSPLPTVFTSDESVSGTGFGGIPLRLTLGFMLNDKFSIEAVGRIEAWTKTSQPVSCEDAQASYTEGQDFVCFHGEEDEEYDPNQVAAEMDGVTYPFREDVDSLAWMGALRGRFMMPIHEMFSFSAFLGVGYGNFKVRVPSDRDDEFLPTAQGFVAELGAALAFHPTDFMEIMLEVPISGVIVSDFIINLDIMAGVGFSY